MGIAPSRLGLRRPRAPAWPAAAQTATPRRQPGGRHYTPLPGRSIPVPRQDRLAVALPRTRGSRRGFLDALADLHALGHVAPCEALDEPFVAGLSDDRTDRRYAADLLPRKLPRPRRLPRLLLAATDARYGVDKARTSTTTAAARCGTTAGYTAHHQQHSTCAACRGAVADYHRQRRAQLKEATA